MDVNTTGSGGDKTMKTMDLTHPVVSKEEWLAARKAHLAREKELTRLRDQVNRERLELPWERVEKSYVFDSPRGQVSLADLFDGRSQLIVYHFMLGPDWKEGCPSCSFLSDHFDGAFPHLTHHDVMLTAVSRAPLPKIEAFRSRMGWRFPWVSSNANEFNRDYGVYFTKEEIAAGSGEYNYGTQRYPGEEAHGLSVFARSPAGEIFHTYSTYGRGVDILIGTYNFLDLTPKGRNESGPMDWIRHHDRYGS
jgi:predicted dithiol-disulfide oxidoreductase (DUF899 family)